MLLDLLRIRFFFLVLSFARLWPVVSFEFCLSGSKRLWEFCAGYWIPLTFTSVLFPYSSKGLRLVPVIWFESFFFHVSLSRYLISMHRIIMFINSWFCCVWFSGYNHYFREQYSTVVKLEYGLSRLQIVLIYFHGFGVSWDILYFLYL